MFFGVHIKVKRFNEMLVITFMFNALIFPVLSCLGHINACPIFIVYFLKNIFLTIHKRVKEC